MKLINVVEGSCRVWLSRNTGRMIGFVFSTLFSHMACSSAAVGEPEKDELKFGFIKLTDMAPLAVAYENGYFEDEGLYVTLEAQANWKVLLDGVIDGQLDGAHMLAGQPLAATIGYGTKAHIVTPFSMDLNGNGITVANEVWQQMKPNIPHKDGKPVHPISAEYLKPVVDKFREQGKPFKMGMVFPVSTHNYELRYWLAAGGIHPGFYAPAKGDTSGQIQATALLSVTQVVPSLSVMEAPNIGVFRSLADARSLSAFSGPGKRALVVGAGLLGLEAAHGLARRGCDVMVLHRRDRIMNRQLDQRGSQQLQRALERQGIRFLVDDAIAEFITAGNELGGVLLQSHKHIATDRLIFATGIVPSIDVASAAGIRCEAGIVVDSYLRTNVPQVYALGECCQYRRQHFGLVAPIRQQAEVLCRELLAVEGAGFLYRKYPTQLKVSGVDVYSAGTFDSADDEENLVFQDSLAGVYRRLVVRDARLTGAVLVGDKRGGSWYDQLIRSGADILAIRSHLMFGREMSNAPQPGRQAA